MNAIARQLESLAARVAVTAILLATHALVALARITRRSISRKNIQNSLASSPASRDSAKRLLLAGTFYNDAWFDAHVAPLLACDAVERITVVTDAPLREVDRVGYVVPSPLLRRFCGRTIARAICVVRAARKHECDLLVGYHIMPNALICLVAARLLGLRAAYQMTGGPVQLIGGGIGSENTLLRRQRVPGRFRELLMHRAARQFDLIVVRGRRAMEYLGGIGAAEKAVIIPAGVDTTRFAPCAANIDYDLISVGRLVPVKRYDRLLMIIAAMKQRKPKVSCAIVGDGPEADRLRSQAAALGIASNISFLGRRVDVADLLNRSRAFILTSETEGQSIAMMEAMAAGLPIVAPDVGELCDLVIDGRTGIVIEPDHADASTERVLDLLNDDAHRSRISVAAHDAVFDFAAVEAVAERWRDAIAQTFEHVLSTYERKRNGTAELAPASESMLVGSAARVDG